MKLPTWFAAVGLFAFSIGVVAVRADEDKDSSSSVSTTLTSDMTLPAGALNVDAAMKDTFKGHETAGEKTTSLIGGGTLKSAMAGTEASAVGNKRIFKLSPSGDDGKKAVAEDDAPIYEQPLFWISATIFLLSSAAFLAYLAAKRLRPKKAMRPVFNIVDGMPSMAPPSAGAAPSSARKKAA